MPDFDNHPADAPTMSPEMPNATNYYRWIVSQIAPYLGHHILDVGGGYGAHLAHILPERGNVTSIDLSESGVRFMRERFQDFPNFQARHADFRRQEVQDDLAAQRFDTITCLNVLEHIEDDLAALQGMHAILAAQNGAVILQVPAHQWLYGSLDSEAGHFRRYRAADLRRRLDQADFEILRLYHFNSAGVVPWFINARILKSALDAGRVNFQIRVFDRYIVPVMQRLESRISPPIGQSLMAIARARQPEQPVTGT